MGVLPLRLFVHKGYRGLKSFKSIKNKKEYSCGQLAANALKKVQMPPFFRFSNKKQSGFRKASAEIEPVEVFAMIEPSNRG